MNANEVGKLLGLMTLADNRKPPEDDEGRRAMIAFWLSMVGDLPYSDAARAVQDHYRESVERIMPAHIRERVNAVRIERLRAAGDLEAAIPPELADRPREYRDMLRALTQQVMDGGPPPPRAIRAAR